MGMRTVTYTSSSSAFFFLLLTSSAYLPMSIPIPALTGLATTAKARSIISRYGPTCSGDCVTRQVIMIESATKAATIGKKHRITSNSVPLMTVVLRSFTLANSSLARYNSSRRSCMSSRSANLFHQSPRPDD
jgi:hypothetical protein